MFHALNRNMKQLCTVEDNEVCFLEPPESITDAGCFFLFFFPVFLCC